MTNSKRNRNSLKGNEEEDRRGNIERQDSAYRKLPDNPNNPPDESISTADDTSGAKYSGTNKRKEDKDNDETENGR